MYSSKLVRPADRQKKALHNKFVPLIGINNDRIDYDNAGIQVLNRITNGSLVIVAFEQQQTQIPYRMLQCPQLINPRNQSGIWISQNFLQDDEYGHKYLALISYSQSAQDKIRIHILNSIIASIVIVNVSPGFSGYSYLTSYPGRLNYSRNESQNSRLQRELANLVILERGGSSQNGLHNDKRRIETIQNQGNLYDLDRYYRSVNFFQFPNDQQLRNNQRLSEQLYETLMQLHLSHPRTQKQLQYGPVLAQFIPQIVKQYDSRHPINFTDCLQRICIDQGYQSYMQSLQLYNENVHNKFNTNQPVQRPQEQLFFFRNKAIADFKQRSGDPQYLMQLNNTINDKQQKALRINDTMWSKRNIDILKRQSRDLLRYAQNRDDPTFDTKKQTERVVRVYEATAGGRKKQQDLNRYLQKLNQTLGMDNHEKMMKLSKLQDQNKRLNKRYKQLQGGCCSKCQIM